MKRNSNKTKERKIRVRARLSSAIKGIRLSVFRSNKYIYAQLINVINGKTLGSVREKDPVAAGKRISDIANKEKVKEVVFDRGPYKYHGKVKSLADSARSGGLKF